MLQIEAPYLLSPQTFTGREEKAARHRTSGSACSWARRDRAVPPVAASRPPNSLGPTSRADRVVRRRFLRDYRKSVSAIAPGLGALGGCADAISVSHPVVTAQSAAAI
jgi:hypothetical protein